MTRYLFLIFYVSSSAFSQVVINEVLYDPLGTDTGGEKIEIANLGSSAVDLTGYDLYPDGIGYFTFPEFTLNAGSIVVIQVRQTGTNSAADLYHSPPGTANMGNTAGSVALFSSTTHNSSTVVSFVQWGTGSQTWSGDAVSAGVWSAAADFVPAVTEGHSLEYDGSGNSSSDWFDQSVPTIGGSNALPVQMSHFAAIGKEMAVELRWRTETEVDNYGFEIQRRGIGATGHRGRETAGDDSRFTIHGSPRWSVIGFIQGSGTSSSPHEYSFTDLSVPPGRYAYRIKQIDHSGSFAYTSALEIEVGLAPREFLLCEAYPNPFNPTTTIEFTLPEDGRVVLKVYDITGREVATLIDGERKAGVYQQAVFDASRIASGVYVARLQFAGRYRVKKLLLVK